MSRLGDRRFPIFVATAFLIAITSRVALFFGSMIVPVPNEFGLPILPLTANTALDLGYYLWARQMYFGEPHLVIDAFFDFFKVSDSAFFLPGPLYPGLLQIFDYGPGNTLPLSSVYLLLSLVLVAGWLWWLWRNGVGWFWLCVFAVLPTPYWFMLNVSTDLLFACIVGAFWLLWFDGRFHGIQRMTSVTVIIVFAALARPNALSLLLFLVIDVWIWEVALKEPGQMRRRGILFGALITVILVAFASFYLPYFSWVVAGNSARVVYFGWLPEQYLDGLWPKLPLALNLGLSWVSLLTAKVLYLTGLRPSFGDINASLILLRIMPGVIMFPGLIWLLLRADWRVRFAVLFFLSPILLGISQDRYVLPIQPVLFYYGTKAWGEIAQLCRRFRTIAS